MRDGAERQAAFDRVERLTDPPMIVLSLAIIPLLLVPLFFDLSPSVDRTFFALDWLVWGIFAIELTVKTYLAPRRLSYLRSNWFDVVIVVVPFLRPLRVVRSARALRVLRAGRATSVMMKASANGREILTRHGLHYGLVLGLVMVFGCASAVYLFERDSGGNITDLGTALWWAATTVTTVGYGDTFPKTAEGRGVGVLLMFVGIALFSLLTANIAAFFVQSEQTGPTLKDVMAKLEQIEQRLNEPSRSEDGSGD